MGACPLSNDTVMLHQPGTEAAALRVKPLIVLPRPLARARQPRVNRASHSNGGLHPSLKLTMGKGGSVFRHSDISPWLNIAIAMPIVLHLAPGRDSFPPFF